MRVGVLVLVWFVLDILRQDFTVAQTSLQLMRLLPQPSKC